ARTKCTQWRTTKCVQ
ncbi:saccharopine dehydrogenase family protein, partial [Vibrio parahaemolyticus EKP-008]